MTEDFDNYDALLSRLRVLTGDRSARIIGIEGFMQAGKSTLSRRLAEALVAGCIENDRSSFKTLYPDGSRNPRQEAQYLDCLDLNHLAHKIDDTLAEYPIVVIEGICLRDVLARIGQQAEITVYVKALSHNSGLWHCGLDLEEYEAEAGDFHGLHREELEYHSRERPHEKADLILSVTEQPPSD